MAATIIDGRAVAARVRERGRTPTSRSSPSAPARPPGLATILVGDDPGSAIYVANKRKACAEAGIADLHRHLPADATQDEVAAVIAESNANPAVSGILLQLPVPAGLDGAALTAMIDPGQGRRRADADQRRPARAGDAGPAAVHAARGDRAARRLRRAPSRAPRRWSSGAATSSASRSALLLLERNATVTICHSRTRDLAAVCARADVLIAAVGVPAADRRRPRQARRGGDRRRDEPAARRARRRRRLRGRRASAPALITPVPGGVGPMTIAMLLRNTRPRGRARLAGRVSGAGEWEPAVRVAPRRPRRRADQHGRGGRAAARRCSCSAGSGSSGYSAVAALGDEHRGRAHGTR